MTLKNGSLRWHIALSDDLIELRQQASPRVLNLRRPVGPDKLAHGIPDHAEALAEHFARRAIGIRGLPLAFEHAKMPGALAGEIHDGVDRQRQHRTLHEIAALAAEHRSRRGRVAKPPD